MQAAETEVLGRTISFAVGGEGAGEVLFIHGFGADRSTWMFTLQTVAGLARTVALDLPGHGRSGTDVGTGDLPFLADVVRAFMDKVGLTRPHLVGHSLGGAVALEIASREPHRVAGLTLAAPAGFGDRINREFTDVFPHLADSESAARTLALLVARPAMISPRMIDDVLAYLARPGVRAALTTIAETVFPEGRQRYRYEDRIAALGMPIQIVWGRDDHVLLPWTDGPATIPVHIMPAAGHLAHMEVPQRFNRILMAALERQSVSG